MEAMTLGYPPEQAGQISVTAAKEDWQEIVDHVWRDEFCLTEDSAGWKLIQMLKGFGVDD